MSSHYCVQLTHAIYIYTLNAGVHGGRISGWGEGRLRGDELNTDGQESVFQNRKQEPRSL